MNFATLKQARNPDRILIEHYNAFPAAPEEFDFRSRFSSRFADSIEQINTPNGRFYQVQGRVRAYPSASTVTELLSEEAIEQWKIRVGRDVAEQKAHAAATRGTTVHRLAETYVSRDPIGFHEAWQSAMPDARANWEPLRAHLDNHVTAMYGLEQRMFSDALRMAGTSDFIGVYDGLPSIIDYKTSANIKERGAIDGYFIQCASYATMWEERTTFPIQQLVVIIATDGEKEPIVFKESVDENLRKLKALRLRFYQERGY